MILQSLIEGIGIGLGIAVIVFLPSRLFPAKPKDSLLANLKEIAHRNKLLDEQNAILRISAGCAVDIKRINQQMLDLHAKHFKAATINEEMLEALEKIAANPGAMDDETGFISGHIATAAIRQAKKKGGGE